MLIRTVHCFLRIEARTGVTTAHQRLHGSSSFHTKIKKPNKTKQKKKKQKEKKKAGIDFQSHCPTRVPLFTLPVAYCSASSFDDKRLLHCPNGYVCNYFRQIIVTAHNSRPSQLAVFYISYWQTRNDLRFYLLYFHRCNIQRSCIIQFFIFYIFTKAKVDFNAEVWIQIFSSPKLVDMPWLKSPLCSCIYPYLEGEQLDTYLSWEYMRSMKCKLFRSGFELVTPCPFLPRITITPRTYNSYLLWFIPTR